MKVESIFKTFGSEPVEGTTEYYLYPIWSKFFTINYTYGYPTSTTESEKAYICVCVCITESLCCTPESNTL